MLPESCLILSNRSPLELAWPGPRAMMPSMPHPTPELRELVQRHAVPLCRELLPNLTLWSSDGPKPSTPVIYEPMLYFTLQGIKRMTVGERQLDHRPGTFLLVSIDVPVLCTVI